MSMQQGIMFDPVLQFKHNETGEKVLCLDKHITNESTGTDVVLFCKSVLDYSVIGEIKMFIAETDVFESKYSRL